MPEHGTRSRYTDGCRCERCRDANNVYQRVYKRSGQRKPRPPLEQRFWEKVHKQAGGCWLWMAGKSNGYGLFTVKRKHWKAHRWAYERFVGPVPDGLELDHLCRNRACVNTAHLEPVTRSENMRRSPLVGRHMRPVVSGRGRSSEGA